jgi:hypothetical protein
MDNFFKSPIGFLKLNTDKINKLFERNDIKLNSTSLKNLLPVFENRIGPNREVEFRLSARKPKVYFKKEETDIVIEYILNFQAYLGNTDYLLIEDDLKLLTTLNLETANDIMFINIVENRLDINTRYGQRSQPTKDNIGLSENEY